MFTIADKSNSGYMDSSDLIGELGIVGSDVDLSRKIAYPEFAKIIRDIVNI